VFRKKAGLWGGERASQRRDGKEGDVARRVNPWGILLREKKDDKGK